MNKAFQLLPDQASHMAWNVDLLALYLTIITVFFTSLIFVLILFFGLYYRKQPGHKAQRVHAPIWLEITWTVIPLGMCFTMFGWGMHLFMAASRPPANAMLIYVIGKQWMWKVEHPEGRKEINELHVPVGRPIKLVLASQDVIHDFGLPAFRIKRDVVPGYYVQEWFTADRVGDYHLFCNQYCGSQHAEMVGTVVVMEEKDYQRWLADSNGDVPMKTGGERLFTSMNCMSCHGQWAPTMAGLYMSKVRLADGRTIVADDDYLRRSILDPGADIVDGYQANSTVLMPTYRGTLDEEQLQQLIEYIKSLGPGMDNGQPTTRPSQLQSPGGGQAPPMRKPGAGGPPPITPSPQPPTEFH